MDIYMKIKLTIGLLYFLQTLTCIQGQYTYTYVGCYVDRQSRALSGENYKKDENNTIEKCIDFCRERNYRYAGPQYGSECFCGNLGYERYGEGDDCTYPCTGNSNQTCGGRFHNSVYSISEVIAPTTTTTPTTTTSTTTTTANTSITSFSDTYPIDHRTAAFNTSTSTVRTTTAFQDASSKGNGEKSAVIVATVGIVAALLFSYSLVVTILMIREKRRSQNGCEQSRNVNDRNPSVIITDQTATHPSGADRPCEYEEVDSRPVQMSDVYESMQESTSHVYAKLNRTEDTEMGTLYENAAFN